jgi:hypothetical protein
MRAGPRRDELRYQAKMREMAEHQAQLAALEAGQPQAGQQQQRPR